VCYMQANQISYMKCHATVCVSCGVIYICLALNLQYALSLEQAKDAVGGGSGGLPNPFEAVKNAVSGSPDLPDPRTAASKVTGSVRP
jgi:hypothetical protein